MVNTNDTQSEKTFRLGELAALAGAVLKGSPDVRITGIGPLEGAGPAQVSFLIHKRYVPFLSRCKAAAIIVSPDFKDLDHNLLITENPYLAMARIAQLFVAPPPIAAGVHPEAFVGEDVRLEPEVAVGPLAHLGSRCRIGRGSRIYGTAYLGRDVQVGEGCLIYPRVTILDGCTVGNNVIIHSGTVIGSDGFGFAQDENGAHVKIPQTGTVLIEDDVEIGANCAVDRATFGRTWIRRGVRIDNLVHIAHNVVVGEHSILVAQVGVSGSTRLGRHVVLAGQVGVVGHIEVGDGVRVGAQSGVAQPVKAGEDVSGSPAIPHREWLRVVSSQRHLPQYREELRQLRRRIQKLEEKIRGE